MVVGHTIERGRENTSNKISLYEDFSTQKYIFFSMHQKSQTIRPFDKLYSPKVFVFIVQARYWLALFRQPIASLDE